MSFNGRMVARSAGPTVPTRLPACGTHARSSVTGSRRGPAAVMARESAATVGGMASHILIEHGETTRTRRLRSNRVKIALAVAALEGILVIAGVIPWWIVVLAAGVALVAYLAWGREHSSPDVRIVSWTAAVSQLVVVLVPVLAGLVVVLAAVVIVLLAAVALAALLFDRR